MEKWDLYTENHEKTKYTMLRGGNAPVAGLYHIITHAWIRNSRGEVVISKRSRYKVNGPGEYECPGGCVCAGETSMQGAIREVREEVGIDLSDSSRRLILSERKMAEDGSLGYFEKVWVFDYDGDIHLERALTPDEVESAEWMSVQDVLKLRDEGKLFRPVAQYLDKVLAALEEYV